MANKRDRAERLATLERLIKPRPRGGRTIADEEAEHGFTQAETERAAEWLALCRRLKATPMTLDNRLQHEASTLAAAAGARWLHCRLQHGPDLCEADCIGEYRHRPGHFAADVQPRVAPAAEMIYASGPDVTPLLGSDELQSRGVPWRKPR